MLIASSSAFLVANFLNKYPSFLRSQNLVQQLNETGNFFRRVVVDSRDPNDAVVCINTERFYQTHGVKGAVANKDLKEAK